MSMIPDWDARGIIPPVRPGIIPTGRDRTPYRVTMMDCIERFAVTPQRVALLEQFLNFRKALCSVGITSGFQWLNGSFAENTEKTELRLPQDIDCVTFYVMPLGENEQSLYRKCSTIFDQASVKQQYFVDSYYVVLEDILTKEFLEGITYWYSLWSHRRDLVWKGFVQIDIDQAHDEDAHARLQALKKGQENE